MADEAKLAVPVEIKLLDKKREKLAKCYRVCHRFEKWGNWQQGLSVEANVNEVFQRLFVVIFAAGVQF
jgi:hypothetical protein